MHKEYCLLFVIKLLKYIIPFIFVAISLIAAEEQSNTTTSKIYSDNIETEDVSYYTNSIEINSEFCLPPQSLSAVALRQSPSKRVNTTNRNNFELDKEGKIINPYFSQYIINSSLTPNQFFVNQNQMLIRFGKLII